MYEFERRMVRLYGLLEDDVSRNLFWARLKYEAEPENVDAALALYRKSLTVPWNEFVESFRENIARARAANKKLALFGAGGDAAFYARVFDKIEMTFDVFCDSKKYGQTLYGHPVISPGELLEFADDYYVMITTRTYADDITRLLTDCGFPAERIIPEMPRLLQTPPFFDERSPKQYFEFPEMFRHGTAFVDGGCFDGTDSLIFSRMYAGKYSKIFAFEPDHDNFIVCQGALSSGGGQTELLEAGLGSRVTSGEFAKKAGGGSYFPVVDVGHFAQIPRLAGCNDTFPVRIVALDDVVGDTTVGMIKMDIEGAEYDALRGAKNTILRDRPFLAICVYHRQGDMLAIMDYLHELAPDYRFYLRHYSVMDGTETVLYAHAVDE